MKVGLRYLNPQLWRSELAAQLTHPEWILLLYLLNGPSVNLIGMVNTARHIMVPESTLEPHEFDLALDRLKALGLVSEHAGHLLVKVWWMNNKWPAILKGKCRPAAARLLMEAPAPLRREWANYCIDDGIPPPTITSFLVEAGLDLSENAVATQECPFDGAPGECGSGIDTNKTPTSTFNKDPKTTTTTMTPHEISEQVTTRGNQTAAFTIALEPISEPYRSLIETKCACLPVDRRQEVADEFTQRLLDAKNGTGPEIHQPGAWLDQVVQMALVGRHSTHRGQETAKRRRQRETNANREALPDAATAALMFEASRKREALLTALVALPADGLQQVIERAIMNMPSNHAAAARSALLNRELPTGHLGSIVVPALKKALDGHLRPPTHAVGDAK